MIRLDDKPVKCWLFPNCCEDICSSIDTLLSLDGIQLVTRSTNKLSIVYVIKLSIIKEENKLITFYK